MGPKDFLKNRFEHEVDRDIVDCVYSTKDPLTANEIHELMESKCGERNTRLKIGALVDKGFLDQSLRRPTGKRGRTPEVFKINESLKNEIDDYLNTTTRREIIKPFDELPPIRRVIEIKSINGMVTQRSSWVDSRDSVTSLHAAILHSKALGHITASHAAILLTKKPR